MSTPSHASDAAAMPRAVDAIDGIAVVPSARVLSGITPSGSLTLGNYLGALRRFVTVQREEDCFFFVADLHAMTTRHDPRRLHELTREAAALFLAAGLDDGRATVFVQSRVPAHVELAYLLECTAHVGELKRMIQFKERVTDPPLEPACSPIPA